jgi:hypothetical protein
VPEQKDEYIGPCNGCHLFDKSEVQLQLQYSVISTEADILENMADILENMVDILENMPDIWENMAIFCTFGHIRKYDGHIGKYGGHMGISRLLHFRTYWKILRTYQNFPQPKIA